MEGSARPGVGFGSCHVWLDIPTGRVEIIRLEKRKSGLCSGHGVEVRLSVEMGLCFRHVDAEWLHVV